jgi:hypothetical protein
MRLVSVVLAGVFAAGSMASAQCSVLGVSGSVNPGQTVTVALTGATPNAVAFLLVGDPGTTSIDLGFLGTLTVGLSQPFAVLPIGMTDGNGDLSLSVSIPANLPPGAIPNQTRTLQIVTFGLVPGFPPFELCASNAVALVLGDGGALAAVRRWHQIAIDASGFDHANNPAHPGPGRASRVMAIVQVAVFESLLAVHGGYQSYVGLPAAVTPVSLPAAIATSAHDTLATLFPAQAASFAASLTADLALIPAGPSKADGIALGASAAAAILALRASDGSDHAEPLVNVQFLCSNQPGFWRQDPISLHPLALGAQWATVTPFSMTSAAQFRAPAPPPMTGAEYATAYDEVKAVGGDGVGTPTSRTPEQTIVGIYWAYDATPSLCAPPRLYNQIAVLIGNQEHLSAFEMGRLLALVNVAMADAAIAVWESKYFYQLWRPVTGIRESDPGTGPTLLGDGNAATVGDTSWSPLGAPASNTLGPNFTPPFPAYPSGHAGFGGALFQMMRRFFGTDDIAFTFVSDEFNGVTLDNQGNPRPFLPRSFPDFTTAEEENGQSRIYLGIHWSYDKTAAIAQGNAVGDWVFDHLYPPVP